MKNILFDLSATQPDKGIYNHGGSEYAKAIFLKLTEISAQNVCAIYDSSLPLESEISEIIRNNSLKVINSWEINSIKKFILENNIVAFYTALPKNEHLPILKLQSDNFKVILTIHGLRSLEFPFDKYEWLYTKSVKSKLKFLYKKLLPAVHKKHLLNHFRAFFDAANLVTVSNHSKYSLLNFFPYLTGDKIRVFYSPLLAYKIDDEYPEELFTRYNISVRKYFLVLSGSIWTKNSYRAIKAFDKLISEHPELKEHKMFITGIKTLRFRIKNNDNFIFTDYVDRNTLENLLKNSLSLVYPTLNEGFGYPPIEAMKYGTPVFTSGIGPIPEVCGDAAYYFNPLDITEIKIKLLAAINDHNLFSESNIQIRETRYKYIKQRQEKDLNALADLIFNG